MFHLKSVIREYQDIKVLFGLNEQTLIKLEFEWKYNF